MSHRYNTISATNNLQEWVEMRRGFNGAMRELEQEVDHYYQCQSAMILKIAMKTFDNLLGGRGSLEQLRLVEYIFDIHGVGRASQPKPKVIINILKN